ncbi:MAG: TRAP transporter small permease [Azospirillaceae bacterium]
MHETVDRLIARIIEVITGLLVLLIAGVLLVQVLGRHLLQYPFSWPEEVAGFLFVWLIFLGAGVAYRRGGLIGIDWLLSKASSRLAAAIKLVSDLTVLALLVGLVWTGVEATVGVAGTSTTVLRFSWGWVYLAFPIGCGLLLFAFARDIARDLHRLRTGGHENHEREDDHT